MPLWEHAPIVIAIRDGKKAIASRQPPSRRHALPDADYGLPLSVPEAACTMLGPVSTLPTRPSA
jgi:hypothetical protein